MCVPVIFIGQGLVNAVVEVFVVREDDMPANIVKLGACQIRVLGAAGFNWRRELTKPSGVISVDASPPGVSFESIIIHDGPFCALSEHCPNPGISVGPYQLMKALSSS